MSLPAISRREFLRRSSVLDVALALPDTGLLAPGEVRTSGAQLTTLDHGDVMLNAYSPPLQPICAPANAPAA